MSGNWKWDISLKSAWYSYYWSVPYATVHKEIKHNLKRFYFLRDIHTTLIERSDQNDLVSPMFWMVPHRTQKCQYHNSHYQNNWRCGTDIFYKHVANAMKNSFDIILYVSKWILCCFGNHKLYLLYLWSWWIICHYRNNPSAPQQMMNYVEIWCVFF